MSKNEGKSAIDDLRDDPELYQYLVERVGKSHLRRRLGVETEHVADSFGQGQTFFNIENWSTAATVMTASRPSPVPRCGKNSDNSNKPPPSTTMS